MSKFFAILKYLFWRKWLVIPALVGLGIYLVASMMTVYVAPGEAGIRQVNYGGSRGVQKQLLSAGLHLRIPGYEQIHTFPIDLQALEMADQNEENSKVSRITAPILIQTSDGYSVRLYATILYRLKDPYTVLTKVGTGKLYEDSVVIPRSDSSLRKALGELNSEEFYHAPKRIQKTQLAFQQLQDEFEEKGLELVKILLRKISYDAAYQTLIEQRKIQDQTVLKNQAESAAAKEEARKREIISTGQAAVQVELERGQREVAQILADANLYRRNKNAEGYLLVQTAKAQGTLLENKALEGAGASGLVGLKMADVLKGIKVIVIPSDGTQGTNPLRVSEILKQFEVER